MSYDGLVPEFFGQVPLVRALRDLRQGERPGTALVYLALTLLAFVALATPLSRGLQRELMEAHHMRPQPLPRWVALQMFPKMYAFAHRVWFSLEPMTEYLATREAPPPFEVETAWINHYPARVTRFEGRRAEIARLGVTSHIFVRSTYRGASLATAFEVRLSDGRVHIRRREP